MNFIQKNYSPDESLFSNMKQYKSVKDFLKKKKSKQRLRRLAMINFIARAIDFDIDQTITPIIGDGGSYQESVAVGGRTDKYLSMNDFDDKDVSKLNIGRDYDSEEKDGKGKSDKPIKTDHSINGLEREYNPEELEVNFNQNNYYGIQDAGNNAYSNI